MAGYDVVRQPAQVRASIGMAGQFTAMDPLLTGRENLVLFGRLRGLRRHQAKARADELIEQFDMVDAADRRVDTYSGACGAASTSASALVVPPKVLFLDEPTTGLDPRSRRDVWALVSSLAQQGVTVLLTTQYLEEADVLSDSIVVIDHGQVIASGTAEDLKRRVGSSYCQVTPANPADLPRVAAALARARRNGYRRRHELGVSVGPGRGGHAGRGFSPGRYARHRTRRHLAAQTLARRGVSAPDRTGPSPNHERPGRADRTFADRPRRATAG